jgi:hypothetical protein
MASFGRPARTGRTPFRYDGLVRLTVPVIAVATVLGCAATVPRTSGFSPLISSSLSELHGTRWLWADAGCSDGSLDLASRGFEQQIRIERVSDEQLLFIYDNSFSAEGCAQTAIWSMTPAPLAYQWQFEEQTVVALPPEAPCERQPEPLRNGLIRQTGDLLEIPTYRSNWCRGFDARFVYRRAAAADPNDIEIIRRWAAHFNRRDARAIAALFAERGSLAEPFSSTIEGVPGRHEGREAVRRWYVQSFAGPRWLVIRPLLIERSPDSGHYLVDWQYMDDRLDAPLEGRNLFLIADSEIYQTELQLLDKVSASEYLLPRDKR